MIRTLSVLVISLVLVGCSPATSLKMQPPATTEIASDSLHDIHIDMSPDAVQSILGPPASSLSRANSAGRELVLSYPTHEGWVKIFFTNNRMRDVQGSLSASN